MGNEIIKIDGHFEYDSQIDKEVVDICDAINSLPGLKTFESCSGHNKNPMRIFFYVVDFTQKGEQGLFFLTRCVDKRYWEYGDKWKIELCVGDQSKITKYPTTFLLHSGESKGIDCYEQSKSLIDNMNHHLNIESFIRGYKINLNNFKISKK